MKKIIAIIVYFFSLQLMAIEVYAPKDNHAELEKIDNPIAIGELPILTLDKNLVRTHHIALFYTQAQTSFEQSGNGQAYDTEQGSGVGLVSLYNRILESGNALEFKFWMNKAGFSEPSDIGGENVAVNKNLFSGSYSWIWSIDERAWSFDLGATILSQNADTFTTHEKLVPNYLAFGPTIALGFQYQLGVNWKLNTKLATSLPLNFQEYGANSGYHRMSLHYLATLLIARKINNSLSFNIGLMVEGEEHRFNGTGQREVEDAVVSTLTFAIPIGVSYAF